MSQIELLSECVSKFALVRVKINREISFGINGVYKLSNEVADPLNRTVLNFFFKNFLCGVGSISTALPVPQELKLNFLALELNVGSDLLNKNVCNLICCEADKRSSSKGAGTINFAVDSGTHNLNRLKKSFNIRNCAILLL